MTQMTTDELKTCVAGLGLTQPDVADTLGVPARTLRNWLSGTSPVPMPAAILLRMLNQGLLSVRKCRRLADEPYEALNAKD